MTYCNTMLMVCIKKATPLSYININYVWVYIYVSTYLFISHLDYALLLYVHILYRVLASFPGPSFSFNRDGEKLGLVHTVCACAELRATRGEKGVCDHGAICRFSREERVEHSIAIFSSQSIRRGSKNVLEAVFAVNVEAGDGMQQPSSIV